MIRPTRGKDRRPRRPRTEWFDWTDVVVGHWLVGETQVSGKCGRAVYRCVSRCGVGSVFTSSELSEGATKTCEGCRPRGRGRVSALEVLVGVGYAPQSFRVVPEPALPAFQRRWEGRNVIKTNTDAIKGKDALRAFEEHGVGVVEELVKATGLGLEFGWSVNVRDVHGYGGGCYRRPKFDRVRVGQDHQQTRKINLKVWPSSGEYLFEVDLACGRAGDWSAYVKRVRDAAAALNARGDDPGDVSGQPAPLAPAGPAPAPKKPAAPSANGQAPPPSAAQLAAGLQELEGIQSGLAAVISITREGQAAAQLREEVAARVEALRVVADPLVAARDELGGKWEAAQEHLRNAELAEKAARDLLAQKVADLEWSRHNEEAVRVEYEQARAAAVPAVQDLDEATRQLAEQDRQEADRQRQLAKTGDVALILQALRGMKAGAGA